MKVMYKVVCEFDICPVKGLPQSLGPRWSGHACEQTWMPMLSVNQCIWSLLLNFSPCTLFFDHLPCCLAQLFDSNPRNPPTSWIQVKMNSSPNIPVIASKMGIQYMPKYGQVNRRAWATVWQSGLIPKTIHRCTEKWTFAQLPYGCVLILTNLPACW